jgi:hypothetical protein
VEIGAGAEQFPEMEYINGIAVAVWDSTPYIYLRRVTADRKLRNGIHKRNCRCSAAAQDRLNKIYA